MATELNNIICISDMHPELVLEHMFGGDRKKLAEIVQCPVHFFPAGNDCADIKFHD